MIVDEMVRAVSDGLHVWLGVEAETLEKLVWTLAALCGVWVVRRVAGAFLRWRTDDAAQRYAANKTVGYFSGFLFLLVAVRLWFGGFVGLSSYFGILSAGLAIALRDPIVNLAGWMFISVRCSFKVGDRIQIGAHSGDVIDIRPLQFTILEIGNWVAADQSTGRIIHIPNGWVFLQSVANYTLGFNFIWNEIPVVVTFESDWERAKEILTKIGNEHSAVRSEQAAQQIRAASEKFLIYFRELRPIVWTSAGDSGIVLTLRYLCEPRHRRVSANAIWEELLRAFAREPNIDFAYPTQRHFDHAAEGKPAMRPPHAAP